MTVRPGGFSDRRLIRALPPSQRHLLARVNLPEPRHSTTDDDVTDAAADAAGSRRTIVSHVQ